MAKDPAFLFYTNDFDSKTKFFTNEQVGKYLRILMAEHQHGRLTEKQMIFICGGRDEEIFSKFDIDENGLYYNKRLEQEIEKRRRWTDSRRTNLSQEKKENKTNNKRKKPHIDTDINNDIRIDMDSHMEIEIEIENEIDKEKDKEKEIKKVVNPFGENFQPWEAWKEYKFAEHRQRYKSSKTEQTAINKLFELARGNPDIAKKIIEQSIANQYQGLFPLKENYGKQQANIRDDVQEALNKHLAGVQQTRA